MKNWRNVIVLVVLAVAVDLRYTPPLALGADGLSSVDPVFAEFDAWAEGYRQTEVAERPALVEPGRTLATRRRQALKQLAQASPERALGLAVPFAARRPLPAPVVEQLETPISGRGSLRVLVADDFQQRRAMVHREVELGGKLYRALVYGWRLRQTSKEKIPLHGVVIDDLFIVAASPLRLLAPGEPVPAGARPANAEGRCPVCGEPGGKALTADTGGITYQFDRVEHFEEFNHRLIEEESTIGPGAAGPRGASPWTTGPKKVLYMRVDFSDLTGEPVTTNSAANMIDVQCNGFYLTNSYNQTSLSADVTPLLRMPQSAAYYGTNDLSFLLLTDARAAAEAAGYDTANYDFDIVAFKRISQWSWAGLGFVGGKGIWLNGYFDLRVTGHELGHNYGLLHANWWETSDSTVLGPGTAEEYGDPFDMMGFGANDQRYHFKAAFKSDLDWLTAGNGEVLTVTNSGVYRVYAHDFIQSGGKLQGLKVVRGGGTNYWIDVRQRFTEYPAIMDGVLLCWETGPSLLLDMTPDSQTDNSADKRDCALATGETFTDAPRKIEVVVLGKTGTVPESFDIAVNLGSADPPWIACAPSGLTNYVTEGQSAISQTFEVWNGGGGLLSYALSNAAPWLAVTPTSGTTTGEHDMVQLNFASAALPVGTNQTFVIIESAGATNSPQQVAVTLVVTPLEPVLEVTPAELAYGTLAVGQSSNQSFQVVNAGGSALTGTAAVSLPFSVLSGSPYSLGGRETGTVVVAFGPAIAGDFTDQVVFSSNGGISSNLVRGTGAVVPVAGFTASPRAGLLPLTVTFTDISTGTITNRHWNFGDGTTLSAPATSVAHTYLLAGTNTVRLIVSGPVGVSTNTQAAYIIVTNLPPLLVVSPGQRDYGVTAVGKKRNASFLIVNGGQQPLVGTSQLLTPGGPFSIVGSGFYNAAWGGTNTVTVTFNPTSAGVFTNRLLLTSNGGSSTNLVIGEAAEMPVASFHATPTSGEAPLTVAFTDTSTGRITSRVWIFGDGESLETTETAIEHVYTGPGTNTVRLIVSGPIGSSTNTLPNYIVVRSLTSPRNLAAVATGADQVTLTWADTTGHEDGFIIKRGTAPRGPYEVIATVVSNLVSHVDTGLAPGTYYYKIRAFSGSALSKLSNKSTVALLAGPPSPVPPAAPTGLFASATPKSNVVSLAWTDLADNENGFKVLRSTDGVHYVLAGSMGQNMTWFTDKWLTPNTAYYYQIQAYNLTGASSGSGVLAVTTAPAAGALPLAAALVPASSSPAASANPSARAARDPVGTATPETSGITIVSWSGTWQIALAGAETGVAWVEFTEDLSLTGWGVRAGCDGAFLVEGQWTGEGPAGLVGTWQEICGSEITIAPFAAALDDTGWLRGAIERPFGPCLLEGRRAAFPPR